MNERLKDNVNELVCYCHSKSIVHGWWSALSPDNHLLIGTRLGLIHSEVSEAMEGYRLDAWDEHLPHRKSVEVELADVLIRVLDLGGALGLDLGGALVEKVAYNETRTDHKPENRRKQGGKRF